MAHTGAPTSPDDIQGSINDPEDAAHDGSAFDYAENAKSFQSGTKVDGVRKPLSRRGVYVIIGITLIFLLAILDGLNVIHVDFGLGNLFPHGGSAAASASPTPVAISNTTTITATSDKSALDDIVNSTPAPITKSPNPTGALNAPTPTPQRNSADLVRQPDQSATATATAPPNPFPPSDSAPVPNLDSSGPSATYQPTAVARAGAPAEAGAPVPAGDSAAEQARVSEMSPAMAIQLAAQTMEPQVAANGAASGTSAAPRTSSAGTVQQQSAAAYASPHGQGYLNAIREPAISKYEIWPGRYLRMLLDTAIIVDLPGQVCAHFIEPARDSQTGTIVLFPERTELCGTYNTLVATGASRIQIAWKQATFPDGSTLALDNMGSADRNGWSGLSADVNNHMGAVYGSAFITSVLAGVAAATDPSSNPNALIQVQTPGQAAGKSILQTGENIVSQKLSLPPTLSLKKSTEILLSVDRAIVLPAYHAIPAMDQK